EIPVLVVWGEKDGWLDPSQAPRLQEQIPGSELELIVGAGHFVMEDAPVEVSRILCAFFAEDAERR
ncbi:MAG TPA: alpha/beta hydrolase, partial [Rubrobacter sp.]|nr:alpha/beta hydrolase [Rubrobacter sp.]